MSWQAMTAVNRHSKLQTISLFRLLLRLAENADATGCVDPAPSQETLASEFGCSVRTVRNRLNQLCDAGELQQTRVGHGPGSASAYQVMLPIPEAKPEKLADVETGIPETNPASISGIRQEIAEIKAEIQALKAEIAERKPEKPESFKPNTGKTGKENRKGHSTESADDPSLIQEDVVVADQDNTTTTASPASTRARGAPAASSGAAGVAAVLGWLGFIGDPAREPLTAETALAWAFWLHLHKERLLKQGKDPVAITIAAWRRPGTQLPAEVLQLARAWLAMSAAERRQALQAAERSLITGQLILPEQLAPFNVPTRTLRALYQAQETFAPPSLMPDLPPPPLVEALADETAPPADPAAALWQEALAELALQMPKATFANLLAGSRLHLNGGSQAQVLAPTAAAAEWINASLTQPIGRTLSAVAGRQLTVTAVAAGGEIAH